MYEIKEPFWQFIDHWQTLIAGLLALAAGVGAVRATIKSANREIAAAQEQTKAAQRQTAVAREIERRRIAREGYAFHAMLEAAMEAVIEDVQPAREIFPGQLDEFRLTEGYSLPAYQARRKINKTAFAELRDASLRFGGALATPFLRLDRDIEDYRAQCFMQGDSHFGANTGLLDQLDRIEQQAIELRDKAATGMKLCREELAKDLINVEP